LDVTEHQSSEEASRISELRYKTLFKTLIEGFCTIEMIFDPSGNPMDYRFLEINPAFEKQTGMYNAQGKTMRELAPNHEAHWFEIYGKVATTGESIHFENEAKALNRYFDVRAYRVGGPESRKVGILFNDITDRKRAEAQAQAQLARLSLLHQITRAIAERQDIRSIFQVVIRTVEEQLPLDFCCICLHDPVRNDLIVASVGLHGATLPTELAMPEQTHIEIDENGLSRCVRGQLVYEPDISENAFPFPRRLALSGFNALVAAPLLVESKVFGVLVAARKAANSFSSGSVSFYVRRVNMSLLRRIRRNSTALCRRPTTICATRSNR
jgi:PAS domain-containing protein